MLIAEICGVSAQESKKTLRVDSDVMMYKLWDGLMNQLISIKKTKGSFHALRSPAAVFILLPASAGTGIVASDLFRLERHGFSPGLRFDLIQLME